MANKSGNREKVNVLENFLDKVKTTLDKEYESFFDYGREIKGAAQKAGDYYYIIYTKDEIITAKGKKAQRAVKASIKNGIIEIRKKDPQLATHLHKCITVQPVGAVYDPDRHETEKAVKWYISFR